MKMILSKQKISFGSCKKGAYLPMIMLMSTLFMAYAVMMVTFSMANLKTAILNNKRITSMAIAEAGINYYMWHLAHNNADYCDGNVCPEDLPYGPYQHNYYDQEGNFMGTYDLIITPPEPGQTKAVVKSIGKVKGISPSRTIVATLEMPAYTQNAFVANNYYLYLEAWEEVDGHIHVNNSGVFNMGNVTGNASTTLGETDSFKVNSNGPYSPPLYDILTTPGTFEGEKKYNADKVSYENIGDMILSCREEAMADEIGDYYAPPNGFVGYHIVFKDDIYTISKVKHADGGYAITQETVVGDFPIPNDGVIFVESNVWLEGNVDNQRVTVIASNATASNSQKRYVVINDSILYSAKDGNSRVGIVATGDIITPRYPIHPTMEINAALITSYGYVWYPSSWAHTKVDGKLTVWGSTYNNRGLSWSWSSGPSSPWIGGFKEVDIIFDPHNAISPPPFFPNSGKYRISSWREE